jgi:hypothetical protein
MNIFKSFLSWDFVMIFIIILIIICIIISDCQTYKRDDVPASGFIKEPESSNYRSDPTPNYINFDSNPKNAWIYVGANNTSYRTPKGMPIEKKSDDSLNVAYFLLDKNASKRIMHTDLLDEIVYNFNSEKWECHWNPSSDLESTSICDL